MSKKEVASLRARVRRLKGFWQAIAVHAGVSYMTIYRLKEKKWETFKPDTIAAIRAAVQRFERYA